MSIIAFPTRASLDLGDEICTIQKEAHLLLEMACQLDRYIDRANAATNRAVEMEAVIVRMTSAIEALKRKANPFRKSQAQLDSEWREFEREFCS